MRVLIVDDEPSVRALISHVLAEVGYSIIAVPSLEEARRYIESRDLAAIVLDLWLPNGHGKQLIEQLKGLRNDLPVVILTGYPDDAPPLEFPISCILEKPPDHLQLVEAVAKADRTSAAIRSLRTSTQKLRDISAPSI